MAMNGFGKWLVETDWLAAHLSAPDIVIIDATLYLPTTPRNAYAEYREAHIPGAIYFDIEELSDATNPMPHMLPSPEKFASRVKAMGIGDGTRVIAYDTQNMSSAARVWWMFRVMGHDDVAILNGGFSKWRAENRPIETVEPPRRSERHFTVRRNGALVRDLADVKALIGSDKVQIVDARSAGRFAGTEPEPREVPRLGHMPGAKNLPYTDLIAPDGTVKSAEAIRAAFEAHGIDVNRPVVASCGSGVTACVIAFGLAQLGKDHTAVYDGSWAEWSAGNGPVTTGER
jgi:thiosulfate/3-mercaptopyruvate sulfurtransferase